MNKLKELNIPDNLELSKILNGWYQKYDQNGNTGYKMLSKPYFSIILLASQNRAPKL